MILLLINFNGVVWHKKFMRFVFIFYAHSEKSDLRVLYALHCLVNSEKAHGYPKRVLLFILPGLIK